MFLSKPSQDLGNEWKSLEWRNDEHPLLSVLELVELGNQIQFEGRNWKFQLFKWQERGA
jgi:hypothetical protein